jgi:hypothetical protein
VNVFIKVDRPVTFYVIRSEKNFVSWKTSQSESVIHFKHTTVKTQKFDFEMEHADDYYFVLENTAPSLSSSGSILFRLEATVVDEQYARERFRAEEGLGVVKLTATTRWDGRDERRLLTRLPVAVLWNAHATKNQIVRGSSL